jgi:integrase
MLNFAVQNELLTSSPFKKGPPLISKADEKRRDRVLTPAEEFRLLAVCTEPVNVEYERKGKKIIATYENRRDLLRAIVIAALDTGLRKNELLTLRWSDVDLDSRLISILAFNSKTARPRTVGITARLSEELQRIRERTAPAPVNLVFDVRDKLGRSLGDNLGRHFRAACVDAAIEGLSFHDLRHTATTRMVQAGLPAPMIMKITGHSQMATFQRYVNPDGHSVQNVADVLSAFNRQNEVAVQAERPEQEYAN